MNVTVPLSVSAFGVGTSTVAVRVTSAPSLVVVGSATSAVVVFASTSQSLTRLLASIEPSPVAQS